jgi:hypothetical protein
MSNEKKKLLTFVAMSMMMKKKKEKQMNTRKCVDACHKCSLYPHIKMKEIKFTFDKFMIDKCLLS